MVKYYYARTKLRLTIEGEDRLRLKLNCGENGLRLSRD